MRKSWYNSTRLRPKNQLNFITKIWEMVEKINPEITFSFNNKNKFYDKFC